MKKKVLIIYPHMNIGGSTTSLLSFLNCLDPDKYSVDLQLFRYDGPLFDFIPKHVNVLSEGEVYKNSYGRIRKILKLIFSPYLLSSYIENKKNKKKGLSKEILGDFQAKKLTRKINYKYDYGISYLEGWSNRNLAFNINATYKYAWIHSTFSKTTTNYLLEKNWIKFVDKIVFVADSCKEEFVNLLPEFKEKAITINNILDDKIVQDRSLLYDQNDKEFLSFRNSKCTKICSICRIDINTKGLDRVIFCAKKLVDSGYDFLWYIIGDGDDMQKLQSLISQNNIENYVKAIGSRMNPYPFISESDFMCMSSRYEGMPMAVTESLMLGVPPVVTEYLSAKQQIVNGYDGIIVNNDDVSLYDTMVQIFEDDALIHKLRRNINKSEYGNKEYFKKIEQMLFED